ncbi:MAG: hypothetical protein IPJ02_16260 [Chitinophagaceae bacterium]|nr:hypothetical protein [Chitinophagaceae bacterium]
MNNTRNKGPRRSDPPGNRFKRYWVYLGLLALVLLPSLLNNFTGTQEISWQQFEKDILAATRLKRS